jgi:hypothetical protein
MSGHTHRQTITAAGTGYAATLDAARWLAGLSGILCEGTG